ncbi:MAG: Type 1 glutamine amidotransferase-like domain-containing protein, partial [Turicibacter sp.]
MKVSFLTSGFPNGFTQEFIKCIKNYYKDKGSFVFIASNFEQHSKSDKYTNIFISMFASNGILFNECHVMDSRTTPKKAIEYIEKADIVWISGGDTLKQISFLKEYNLIPALQIRNGITIGMSAGSINMAKRVVLAKDV